MIVVVGAGAAGLALVCRLAAQGTPDVVLVSAPEPAPPRTWCSWVQGPQWWDDAVSHTWHRVALHDASGAEQQHDLAPLRYTMVRSPDYEALADRLLEGRVERRTAAVSQVRDGTVVGDGGLRLAADLVFDTRPAPPLRPGRTALLQHFRGWFVRTAEDAFDPAVAGLMDFRPAQPAGGVAFRYVLPASPREALVEHTVFSRAAASDAQYDAALAEATAGLPPFEVRAVERGAIPMTDAPFARRVGPRVFRLGGGGGATRPSTGYTFSGAQRQAEAVAAAVADGRDPCPPLPYPPRHLLMDAVLLRALDRGGLDGAAFFADLFRRHPVDRVLRFLDGSTTLREDLAVMASAPRTPMLRAALASARHR